jgi:hypothetical protein
VAENVPDAWVNKTATIRSNRGQEEHRDVGVLRAVNDRGVVLDYREERTFFYPWWSVIRIDLGEPQKAQLHSF